MFTGGADSDHQVANLGACDPMQGSQYTFRLVQICTPEPCKLVLMTDKKKRRLLCMVQVYKSCVDGLCTYQAFYRICCRQAGNKFTMLSGLDKQLLVKLGGLDTSVPNVATVSLAVCCKALKLARVPAAMLAAFEDIRLRPNSLTVLAFPDHVLAPYAQPSPNPVAHQLPRCHKDPASLLAAGKWMSAPELVHIIDTAWKHAELDLQQEGVTVQTSRQLHDAALASVTFSHLPPIRLSCIRGLVAPSFQGPCLHPDCKLPGCEGNRLYIITTSPLLMRIKLPHHKNACKWGQASIEFDLPAELAELLYTYLGESRRALLDHHLLIGQSCPYVFMDMHGRGFAGAVLTLYWQKWLVLQGGVSMNPSMCRQVFVDERASNTAAAGPSSQGAAMVMGHSEQQWRNWYDLQFHPRLAQNAVNSMQLWRTAMLQIRSAAAELSLSTAPHCRHVVVSDSESDCEEYQSCKSDSIEDSGSELDLQADDDIELDLQADDDIELDLQ
ncbi:TPA: hypothetical protein ACH3X1_016439 [Trebouxia sp. C0004]